MSDESEMWRLRIAEAAGSVERHSSQECVRASSSSMSGDILEDFSFTDDVGDQENPINQMHAGSSRKDLVGTSNGKSAAAAEPAQSPAVSPIKKVASKNAQPKDRGEVRQEPSVANAPVTVDNKGKSIKPNSSKAGQSEKKPDRKGSVDDSGSSTMNASSPPKKRDSKKLLTKKVYSNANSPVPRSPARKDGITRDGDTPVSGQRHQPQHRGSTPLPVVRPKKPRTATQPVASTKDATKLSPSPRRKSITCAGSREKENKLPPQSRKKDLQEMHEGDKVQEAESRTGSTEKRPSKTTVDVLPTHETSKIDRRMTIDTAQVQSSMRPVADLARRTTVIPVVKTVEPPLTAKQEVSPEHTPTEDLQTTKKKAIVASKGQSKNAVTSKKNPTQQLNSVQVGHSGNDKENSPKAGTRRKESLNDSQALTPRSSVRKGKLDTKNSPTNPPPASKETLAQDRSLDMDTPLEKHKKKSQRKDDSNVKAIPQISTAATALRRGSVLPEQRPLTSTGRRDSRKHDAGSDIRARVESPRATTPDALKEAIQDDNSEGRRSPGVVVCRRISHWLFYSSRSVSFDFRKNRFFIVDILYCRIGCWFER